MVKGGEGCGRRNFRCRMDVVIEMVKENMGGTSVDLADEVTDIGGWAKASVEETVIR